MSATRTGLIPILLMACGLAIAGCGPAKTGGGAAAVTSTGTALVGGPFQLVDQDNRPVDQHVLDGKWSAVFFGYTYCPDVCPTTLQALAQAKAKLGPDGKALQVVFVSIDPERDTPAQIKGYLATPAFPQPTLGLTGTPAQVAAAAKAYRVYYQKVGTGDGYTMNHSSVIYLMDPQGRFDRVMTDSQTPAEIVTQVRDAMRMGPKART
jgi:protein SCO1/2